MNPYARAARLAKANKLAIALDVLGETAAQAEQFTTDQRRAIALTVGVNPPSDETWALTIEALQSIESSRARLGALV